MLAWGHAVEEDGGLREVRFILLLPKCKHTAELAAFGKLLLRFPLRNEDGRIQEGGVVTLKTLFLPSSWLLLCSLFKTLYLSRHLVLQFVWRGSFFCTTPTADFNSASVILIVLFCYLGLLAFWNRKVCQREDKID